MDTKFSYRVGEIYLNNDEFIPKDFKLEYTTIWSFRERGSWAIILSPGAIEYSYKTLFDNITFGLLKYNQETIIAEKFQTVLVNY